MKINKLKPRKALNKAFLKVKPNRTEIERFKTNLIQLLDRTNDMESEEFHKNLVIDFLKKTYYDPCHFINTKGRNDLVIHNGDKANSTVGVILEAKKPTNKSEMPQAFVSTDKNNTHSEQMPTIEKLNTKAFQELILYYLRERITHKNLEVKHLVITNINEWFIFDATTFDRLFAQNKHLVKQFNDFEGGRLADTKTDFFYKQIAEPFIADIKTDFEFTYFNLQEYQKPLRNDNKADDNSLIALFKLLSPEHLLKLPFTNDSNSLDKRFYSELLHIIGLTETKEGGKKLIGRNKEGERNTGSILEDAIIQLDSMDKIGRLERPSQFGNTQQERLFNVALELSITWINRILFLKLLEAQLITYHKGDKSYSFLNLDKIKNYDDLNSLFFQVLARKHDDRNPDVKQIFEKVPYLNSSLFEPTEIEQVTLFISNLKDEKTIPILSSTVLKNDQGKKRTGKLSTLEYLFEFLNAYDFSSEGSEEIQEDNKTLINASVLGLIFEKINGYKDGSFFTPGFITMYMCRETIRKAVVQKFNDLTPGSFPKKERGAVQSPKHPEAGTSFTPLRQGEGSDRRSGGEEDFATLGVTAPVPPELLHFARELRKNQTPAEELLWQLLRNRKLNNWKFRRQHPIQDGFILDFFCAETKLAIEIDGGYHEAATQREYDEVRTKELEKYGVRIIRFRNEEVLEDPKSVLERIVRFSVLAPGPSPKMERGVVAAPISFQQDIKTAEASSNTKTTGDAASVTPLQQGEGPGVRYSSLSDIYNAIGRDFTKQQANAIINSLKICDPAVGSGHFLVSALNEIIAIKNDLKILMDREGRTLRDYHVEVVNDELIVTDEDGKLFDYNPTSRESQRIQEMLFHEKQTIIENCLFGVDINPNSVKICRLRLWIELLKNAYYKNATELETLPNIDINIKCGNSLVSRFDINSDLKQALRKSKWTIDSYRMAVDTYRNAENKEQKREMERLIADIKSDFRSEISMNDPKVKKLRKISGELFLLTNQQQIFEMTPKEKADWNKKVTQLTEEIKKAEAEIEEIKANKIFENAFEWRFEFPEVLNDDGDFMGFDVVIGNPPWGASLSEKELKFIKNWSNDVVVRMIDTFMFFINLSFIIKSNQGLICQIIPDVILYQIDNIKLRKKILTNYQLLIVANLGDNIFEDVARPSCILQIGNKSYKPLTKVFEYRTKDHIDINDIVPIEIETSLFSGLPNTVFATRNITGYKILHHYNQSFISDLIDSDGIQRGISPDLKEAFIIDDALVTKYSLEMDYIYPTITGGKDVRKYLAEDIGKKIIYTKKTDSESNISNIINYISNFRSYITCTEVKQGKHPFWALHRSREKSIFEKDEKIVGVITGDKISVSIDTCRLYPTDGMYIFSSNAIYSNLFLVGLLNSKLLTFFYRLISMEENRTLAQIKPSVLQHLPASTEFNAEIVIKIEKLTFEVIERIKGNNSVDELISEIDQLVYQLYGLTEEEIKIVEGK